MAVGRNIVITGIQAWDIEIGSNCKNIASEMAQKDRVLYVNAPLDLMTLLKKRKDPRVKKRIRIITGKQKSIEEVSKQLLVFNPPILIFSANWLPRFVFKWINRINSIRIAGEIKKVLKRLDFESPILFSDSDMFRSFHIAEQLPHKGFIYYSRDNLMTVPYWRKHGAYYEPEIMRKATMVVSNSPHLTNLASVANPNAFYVGQGCETGEYSKKNNTKPTQMNGIEGPIIGYVGLLSERRLSISAISYLAKQRPKYQIVLVGPEEKCFATSELHSISNVHFLGSVSPAELPAFVQSFDVCFNPQVLNDLTKGNYPRKIDEYLAAGKPTVATYTPTMEVFKDHCYLASTDKEYPALVDLALEEDSSSKQHARSAFAETHTWKNSVDEIWKCFNRIKS